MNTRAGLRLAGDGRRKRAVRAVVERQRSAPKIDSALSPMFKSTVRGVYKLGQKTKEFAAETNEHVRDIVAECDAEAKDSAPSA